MKRSGLPIDEDRKVKKTIPIRKGKPHTRRRKLKPLDYPKRPLSAYNIFFMETRTALVEEKNRLGQTFSNQEIVKEVAEKWKTLSKSERESIESLAREDLQRYKSEVVEYDKAVMERGRQEQKDSEMGEDESDEESSAVEGAEHISLEEERKDQARMRLDSSKKEKTANKGSLKPSARSALPPVHNQGREDERSLLPRESAIFPAAAAIPVMEQVVQDQPRDLQELRKVLESELRVLDAVREEKLRLLAELQRIASQQQSDVASIGSPSMTSYGNILSASTPGTELDHWRQLFGLPSILSLPPAPQQAPMPPLNVPGALGALLSSLSGGNASMPPPPLPPSTSTQDRWSSSSTQERWNEQQQQQQQQQQQGVDLQQALLAAQISSQLGALTIPSAEAFLSTHSINNTNNVLAALLSGLNQSTNAERDSGASGSDHAESSNERDRYRHY